MSFINRFKKFAFRGNVIDLAVGVIIGAAFGGITSSLVNDVVMPPLGVLLAGINFSELSVTIKQATVEDGQVVAPAVMIAYGKFIQVVINFFIIAVVVFLFLEGIDRLKKKEEEKPGPTPKPEPTESEKLLGEIRDLLRHGASAPERDTIA